MPFELVLSSGVENFSAKTIPDLGIQNVRVLGLVGQLRESV